MEIVWLQHARVFSCFYRANITAAAVYYVSRSEWGYLLRRMGEGSVNVSVKKVLRSVFLYQVSVNVESLMTSVFRVLNMSGCCMGDDNQRSVG